jgi:hypothetical protein
MPRWIKPGLSFDSDQPQVTPRDAWPQQFLERIQSARRMLLAGATEKQVRDEHGSVVLKEACKPVLMSRREAE